MSIDTNVVVRFLVGDNLDQHRRAASLIRDNPVFVSLTVLLETEWVLRDSYEIPRLEVVRALQTFAGLPSVALEDSSRALQALDWAEAGMDFADALHLAGAAKGGDFVSFDRKLAKVANRLGAPPVRAP